MIKPDSNFTPILGKWSINKIEKFSCEFYACRLHDLNNPMLKDNIVLQVLVMALDQLTWININPEDIIEWQGKPVKCCRLVKGRLIIYTDVELIIG